MYEVLSQRLVNPAAAFPEGAPEGWHTTNEVLLSYAQAVAQVR